ncbi:GNAT family N-acetyltransferase [Flavobacterium aquiphilum]|uniref:GNAT family N-acetyltransferase n=1 Tax=Flavobacterium aquiphilum TaxID=3003261 RepID=UPI0024813A1C|nr:GNAT family N-acetyltransferase [Flavobacterium aquiphilum]
MKKYTVKRFTEKDYANWNAFISKAKNATFLFHRDFMDYHKDRFEDYSLMIYKNEKLVAILPANKEGECVYSHQGLTYGGLVYGEKLKLASVILVFKAILIYLKENGISKIQLKLLPSIYHNKPAEELNYALFLAEAQLFRRQTLSVIDLSKPVLISKGRQEGIKKGILKRLEIKETNDFEEFWNKLLIPNLEKKYQSKPVHNLEEITNLKKSFPKNIRQFNVYDEDVIVAGATLFESENVIHSQYISAGKNKNETGSLDFLYYHLIMGIFKDKKFFDFGTSNESQGKILNKGLSFWKESFGASTVVQDFYEVETANFFKLENVLR